MIFFEENDIWNLSSNWSPSIFAGQMLLLEAEDEMKSKRISEIQNFLAEKMQEAEGKCFESQTGECFFFYSL